MSAIISKLRKEQSQSCQDCDLQVVITGLLLLLPLIVHSDHLRLPDHPPHDVSNPERSRCCCFRVINKEEDNCSCSCGKILY